MSPRAAVLATALALLMPQAGRAASGPADLLEELSCPGPVVASLRQAHAGAGGAGPVSVPEVAMCQLALDALCASTPQAAACSGRRFTGAYGGYYVARHAMPLLPWLRSALDDPHSRGTDAVKRGFQGIALLLDLLDPRAQGCGPARYLRTWCTVSGERRSLVGSHRFTTAYFVSEAMRLMAGCVAAGPACPLADDPRLPVRVAMWYDALLWDHVFLDATPLRNSLTRTAPGGGIARRLAAHAAHMDGGADSGPFLFQLEGFAGAIAANLLATDRLLADGGSDPRPWPLADSSREVLLQLVDRTASVLESRLETTQVFDFDGTPRSGAQFDARRWDTHGYRRLSAATGAGRPFEVEVRSDGPPVLRWIDGDPGVHPGTGLDTGHTRRVVWVHYTLWQTGALLERDWVSRETLEGLAAQFAYGVFRHRCRDGSCTEDAPPTPRFANYLSGHDGWYRLAPDTACTPGVPPSGFSTQMLLSEYLWWARFNPDVKTVWQAVERAASDAALPPPSAGDRAPCGPQSGEREWHWTYHAILDGRVPGRSPYYRLAHLAMDRWAALALAAGD